MKKILNIFTLAVLTVMAASCNKNVEFQHETFATFASVSYNVPENVGKLVIPVKIYNPTGGELQVTVMASGESAVQGTDYEIVNPASGILTFSGDVDSLAVEIDIKSFEGEFTGAKDFIITLGSATSGLSVGNFNTAKVTIADLDHPLAPFIGVWTATTFEEAYMGQNVTMKFDISADPQDYTKVVISTVDAMMSAVIGLNTPIILKSSVVLNEDGTGQIVIPNGQLCGFNYGDGEFVYMGINAPEWGGATGYQDIVMNLNADGTMTVPNGFGIFDDKYIWACYVGGYTLTKK